MNENEIIYLNSAFGLLIDRADPAEPPNGFERYLDFKPEEDHNAMFGRIRLPQLDDKETADCNGTGNILIKGNPGSGKTTLALQIAMACANYPNNMLAVYYSLEESPDTILNKVRKLNWNSDRCKVFRKIGILSAAQEDAADDALANELARLTNGEPCVLLPAMSPRGMNEEGPSGSLFAERYHQLELLLRAARELRRRNRESEDHMKRANTLALVCIDSLSVFGGKPLTRQETHMLFELFKYYKVIGVFIGENVTSEAEQVNACDYISDVVIRLEEGEEYGHLFHYVCVEKSRYQPQVFGRHPYRIRTTYRVPKDDHERKVKKCFDEAFIVHPSVHYLISKQRRQFDTERASGSDFFQGQFKIEGIDALLPLGVLKNNYVISILGPQSTFKTDIAKNFLASGVLDGENVLYINLSECLSFSWNFRRSILMEKLIPNIQECFEMVKDTDVKSLSKRAKWKFLDSNIVKLEVAIWRNKDRTNQYGKFLEIVFKNGALLPEELLDYTLRYIKQHGIQRVVLDDINQIGVCYPCLRQNKITGEMFLPAFVRLLSNFKGMKLVILGTTEQAKASEVILDQARTLSDATLTTIMKDDYTVEIFGEGLIARNDRTRRKIEIEGNGDSTTAYPFKIIF